MQLQSELSRLRQDLQDRATQEEQLRQQITEKEEKTRKAIVAAKSKIAHLAGKFLYTLRFKLDCESQLIDVGLKLSGKEKCKYHKLIFV